MEHKADSPAFAEPVPASLDANPNLLPDQGDDPPSLPATITRQPGEAAPATPAPFGDALDPHGFDPAAYDWVPVLRKPRKDGFTPQRQRDFITALAATGCVEQAAREVGMTPMSCYRLRNAPGGEAFSAAWDVALRHASARLVDLAFERAVNGSEEPVFDRDGNRVGRRMKHNDRLLMFLLSAYQPQRFGGGRRDRSAPAPLATPEAPPLGEALARMAPAMPEQPHLLMAPQDLADALELAELRDGGLPHWHRDEGDAPQATAPSASPWFDAGLKAARASARSSPGRSRRKPR